MASSRSYLSRSRPAQETARVAVAAQFERETKGVVADLRRRIEPGAIDLEQPREEAARERLVLREPGLADTVFQHVVVARIAARGRVVRIQREPGFIVFLEQRVERARRQRKGAGKRQQQDSEYAWEAHGGSGR